jgi:hypothetical protein
MEDSLGEAPQIAEVGGTVDGEPVVLDRRLYVQLLAFGGCTRTAAVIDALATAGIPAVVYEDANDPAGIAVLIPYEDPSWYFGELRPVLQVPPFTYLTQKHAMSMLGRTYAIGYERDLVEALIDKPMGRLAQADLEWAVWYPLRRKGEFEALSAKEKHDVMTEHMQAGIAFARAGHIADVRLACHGLGTQDNDFIVGLLGPQLHPLSQVVQLMRKSKQTSRYLASLGPFFVGRVAGRTLGTPHGQRGG